MKKSTTSLTKFIRDIQSRFEAIPTLGAIWYNTIPRKTLAKPERKIADDIVRKIKSGTILDLGSGTGYLSIEVAKMALNLQVYGVDLSRKMVEISNQHAKDIENVHFVFGNASKLFFEDSSIDFIVSTGSLHHWKEPIKVFEECYRVLKKGKEAWIYDGCPDALRAEVDKVRKEYGFFYKILTKLTELHGFTLEEYESKIKDILEQTRFRDSYRMELRDMWMKITLRKV